MWHPIGWMVRLDGAGGRMRHPMVGLVRWGQPWWTMRHPMDGLVRWGQRWGTMRHPMVGVVRWGQHWWTMPHPMVGLVRWGQRWWTMRHPIGGLCAWTAPVDDAASDGWLVPWTTLVDHASEDRRCPHRAKIRRAGAAERGTRRFPDFQDHYSIRKCSLSHPNRALCASLYLARKMLASGGFTALGDDQRDVVVLFTRTELAHFADDGCHHCL